MANNFTSKNISSISLENIIYNLKSVPFHATAAEWELAPLNAYVPKQGEIVVYDKDENHDYIRIKIGDGINNPNGLDFYAGSWNDLVDKPFGETTVKGDTLTWDGNTEGLVSTDDFSEVLGTLYKISDAVPTLEDCISGATYTVAYDGKQENRSVGYDKIAEMSGFVGCLCIVDLTVLVAPENNFQIEVEGITAIFPEAGLYTAVGGDTILKSLTIPGYNGFETTTIKPIETKYLPEHLQFGTETKVVEGDTLTWDGNTEGRVCIADMLYKISDNVLTIDDVQNGAIVTASNKEATTYSADQILEFTNAYGFVCFGGVYSVPSDNFEVQGMVFPQAGIYVMAAASNPIYTESITIPGYNGFVSKQTVVKKIDEKYLPESIATISYIDEAIAAIDIPDVSNFITESELNEAVGGLGSAAFTETTDYMLAGQVIDGGAW